MCESGPARLKTTPAALCLHQSLLYIFFLYPIRFAFHSRVGAVEIRRHLCISFWRRTSLLSGQGWKRARTRMAHMTYRTVHLTRRRDARFRFFILRPEIWSQYNTVVVKLTENNQRNSGFFLSRCGFFICWQIEQNLRRNHIVINIFEGRMFFKTFLNRHRQGGRML